MWIRASPIVENSSSYEQYPAPCLKPATYKHALKGVVVQKFGFNNIIILKRYPTCSTYEHPLYDDLLKSIPMGLSIDPLTPLQNKSQKEPFSKHHATASVLYGVVFCF